MADMSTLARPYAKAAFDYAKEQGAINYWHDYLTAMNSLIADKTVADFIQNPAIDAAAKVNTLLELYGHANDDGSVFETLSSAIDTAPATNKAAFINFLTQLAEQDRLLLLPSIYERFSLLKAADAQEVHAYVTTAFALTDEQRAMLKQQLAQSLNAGVILHVDVDPSLIAGATIKIGDRVVDDSVRGKLKQLKTQLTA